MTVLDSGTMEDNVSSHRHFVLDGFSELGALRPLLFLPFFTMFVVSLSANSLLLYVIASHRSLHSPMYVLIGAMACVDLSVPLLFAPHMLLNFLFGWGRISLMACLVQMFFVHVLGAFQTSLLLCMALDRYFAVCTPLYYHQRTASPGFLWLAVPLLTRNVLLVSVVVSLAGRLTFCSTNVLHHCFCEHMALVGVACGSTALNSLVGVASVLLIPVLDFFFISTSYVLIFSSALRSGASGLRALHTCVTHVVVMAVSLTIVLTAFLSQRSADAVPSPARVFFSVLYLFFPSCFNPVIYGLRTTEIRQRLLKTTCRGQGTT